MKILDIHSHVLPGIDDGAHNETESVQMLQLAFIQGVHGVAATPHNSMGQGSKDTEEIIEKCRLLEHQAQREIHPDFRVYPGQEIFYSQDIIEKLSRGELLTMAGTSYVFIEFHPSAPYSVIFNGVRNLSMAQYWPILAHMERYAALREEGRVEELIRAGALMQMNYERIGGKWFSETTRWCRKMLKNGSVHLLGTDMHDIKSRPPRTQEAVQWMTRHLEDTYIDNICRRNSEQILNNHII